MANTHGAHTHGMCTKAEDMPTTIQELTMIQCKPKYFNHMLTMLPTSCKMYEKCGAKYLGCWTTETGEMCKIVTLKEWPSMEKRMQCCQKKTTDPEFSAHSEKCMKFILHWETFLCKSDPMMTMKPMDPTMPVFFKRYRPKKSDLAMTMKLREACTMWEKEMGPDYTCNMMLHPICYNDHCMFTVWQVKKGCNVDKLMNKAMMVTCMDPNMMCMADSCADTFNRVKNIMCMPVDFNKLPHVTH